MPVVETITTQQQAGLVGVAAVVEQNLTASGFRDSVQSISQSMQGLDESVTIRLRQQDPIRWCNAAHLCHHIGEVARIGHSVTQTDTIRTTIVCPSRENKPLRRGGLSETEACEHDQSDSSDHRRADGYVVH